MGPDNYVTAFNLFRPISYNQTALWAARYATANNYYFTLITEVGFAGLAAISVLLIGIYRAVVAGFKQKNWEIASLALLVVISIRSGSLFPFDGSSGGFLEIGGEIRKFGYQ